MSTSCGTTVGDVDASPNDTEFSYLDTEDFRHHYAHPSNPSRMFFYVENVHCTSCLFRIENLKTEMEGIRDIRLDMGRHIADIELDPGVPMGPVATQLKTMGYTPHPVAHASLADESAHGHKSLLIKIGIAGAVAGNIMLLTTSLYSGARQSPVGGAFEWLSFFLFLPVLFYSAVPFYKNSWTALRNRRSSIDIPIVGAIVIGTILGFYHLIIGEGDVYFDSLAVLVFLLLGSRYFLYRLQHKFLGPGHLRSFYETTRVRVVNPATGQTEQRHIDRVKMTDEVVVYAGERIPVDGPLVSDEAYVNGAVLTGEPEPQRILMNQPVFAGTQLMSGTARIKTEKVGQQTRVGNLLEEAERGVLSRTPLISLTDTVAQWFTVTVLALGIAFAVIYSLTGDIQEAINRGLALVILACPCALALATPLTQSLALKKAAKRGCLIKKAEAFEKLYQVRKVFFDKTGTLTKGELELTGWWPEPPDAHERAVIHALEKDSPHPIARLLATEVSKNDTGEVTLDKRKEIQGTGVEGYIGDDQYEFRSLKSDEDLAKAQELARGSNSLVALYRNGALQKIAALGDTIRESSADVVAGFKRENKQVYLLTGDAERPAKAIGSQVGIEEANVLYQKSPEEKQAILKRSENEKSLMVGDGINDSVALASAHVSVAVQGSMEASFRVADIYLTQPGLVPLMDLFRLSRTTISIIKRNLLISLVYNSAGGTLALLGFINPLVAAVLMPISSVTVVLSSVIGNRFWRSFGRHSLDEAVRPAMPDAALSPLATKGGGA